MPKTRLLLLSDTHTLPPSPRSFTTSSAYRNPLPTSDILIHAGDITKVGLRTEHLTMLSMLKSAPAKLKLVIAGNHDITLDQEYYSRIGHLRHRYRTDHLAGSIPSSSPHNTGSSNGSSSGREGQLDTDDTTYLQQNDPREIKALYTSDEAYRAGIRYLEEGTYTFTLPGEEGENGLEPTPPRKFTVYASPYTPEFCQWAFAYHRDVDRFNIPETIQGQGQAPTNPIPDHPNVDIIITHGPPYGVLDQVVGTNESVGCKHLFRATERARPRLHVFGHIHEGYGAKRLDWRTRAETVIRTDRETALEERCAYLDVSAESSRVPLRWGEETLFVNASVVTVRYEGNNAPWLVDLDLPAAD